MGTFAERLREEIEYVGISQRELAERAAIKKRALDMYLGSRESMPPADVAVRIAKVLNVTVEYLVTGKKDQSAVCPKPVQPVIEQDLRMLPKTIADSVSSMIHALAEREKSLKAD